MQPIAAVAAAALGALVAGGPSEPIYDQSSPEPLLIAAASPGKAKSAQAKVHKGRASFYSRAFNGRRTASGERLRPPQDDRRAPQLAAGHTRQDHQSRERAQRDGDHQRSRPAPAWPHHRSLAGRSTAPRHGRRRRGAGRLAGGGDTLSVASQIHACCLAQKVYGERGYPFFHASPIGRYWPS